MLVRNKNLMYEIDDDTVSGSSKVDPKDELIAGLKAERLRLIRENAELLVRGEKTRRANLRHEAVFGGLDKIVLSVRTLEAWSATLDDRQKEEFDGFIREVNSSLADLKATIENAVKKAE